MKFDDFASQPNFPRKLLDKKAYVRLDPETGEPQLVRVEPNVAEDGEVTLDTVIVTIDDGMTVIMEREVAEHFIASQKCVPLEEFSDWKHRGIN
jgi:hypothetical protein